MFYVYEHIRPDTGMVFYVGKGSGYRLNSRSDRNRHWKFIVNKASGFSSRIIFKSNDEELVLLVEQERIDQLRKLNIKLCNITDGGEGISGLKHSQKSKEKMREAALSREHKPHTEESKQKIRLANTGVVFTEERKEKIRQKAIGRKMSEATKNKLKGRNFKHSEETLKRMCEIQKNMPKQKCLHCSFVGNAGNLARWHNDKCKNKE